MKLNYKKKNTKKNKNKKKYKNTKKQTLKINFIKKKKFILKKKLYLTEYLHKLKKKKNIGLFIENPKIENITYPTPFNFRMIREFLNLN